jgi:hypothetical protein
MNIKTLSDAVTIVEFLISHQGKSVEAAMKEAEVPVHLRKQLLTYFAPPLEITSPNIISDDTQKIPYCNPDTDSSQQYFGALRRFLIDVRQRPKSIVGTLEETSLELVRKLPKPDAVDQFKVKGLVVGYIQSGKTAAMAALIARAADEGYKLFIVLGGLWKDLRSQTQQRLDQEITGESDNSSDAPFVQHDAGMPRWARLTQSGIEGDFKAGTSNDLDPKTPKLAVIKKNMRIEKLLHWLEKTHASLKDLPAVIIDDESDQGSINTNYGKKDDDGEDIDPTATNRRIRMLLEALPKSVYIGFTATPFANVLIDASEEDLYPKDFIVSLPEPAGYFGPRKLFGLGMEPSDLSPDENEKPVLDVIRYVGEADLDQIDRALESGGAAPSILSEALMAFILSSCARLARGHDQAHFSMLVHPSQQTSPHRIFANAIKDELLLLRSAAARPVKFPDVMKRAEQMWKSDFQRVTKEQDDPDLTDLDFKNIWKFAKTLTESIEIKVLNIYSPDKLDYSGGWKRYVVVGGNKLSRGLTLEGLSVSLFTRDSSQYDTLLQMGRWFGYRPGYYDLTRIYVDKPMAERFAELARVEDELRADLRKYAQRPDPPTPLQLKPIIRSHPTMTVTSRIKMGAGRNISISFENTTQQTVAFPVDNKSLLRKNIDAGQGFISALPGQSQSISEEGMHIWKDIPASSVIDFLQAYEFSREARDVNRQNLVSYINRQNKCGELTHWDVVLPRGNPKQDLHTWIKGIFTRKIIRVPMTSKSIRVLSSPSDIKNWLGVTGRDPKDASHGCIMLYLIDRKSGMGGNEVFFEDASKAEDILGLVFIFPESKSHETIEYISQ